MQLKKITLEGFKKFSNKVDLDFSESKELNTISGKNGSGKTTIADAMLLLQQSVFLKLLQEEYPNNEFTKNASSHFIEKIKAYTNKDKANIQILFYDNEDPIEFNLDIFIDGEDVKWEVTFIQGKEKLLDYWKLDNPNNIIMFIESNKHYNESDMNFSDLSIETSYVLPVNKETWITLNMIFFPSDTFNLLYKNLIKDWAYERLIPTKGKVDLYYKISEELTTKLFENIKFDNVSANNFKKDEVVKLVSNQNTGGKRYDLRQLSSGEKTIFYSLMYLNLVDRISLMIMDEPENHLHEDLIYKFLNLFKSLCDNEKTYAEVLRDLGVKNNIIEKYNKFKGSSSSKIGQVFLFTHSKPLIYSNFNEGSNYIIDTDLKIIRYEECEKKLRELGVSALYNRVLFVEGKTESELFRKLITKNIKIEKMESCNKLLQVYRGIKEVDSYIRDFKFLFILDADEANEEKVKDILERNIDDFILLDRHEIENYLIDIDIWLEASLRLADDETKNAINYDYIESKLKESAISQMQLFKKQYISGKLNNSLASLIQSNHRYVELEEDKYMEYIEELIKRENIEKFIEQSKEVYHECMSNFSDERIERDWINICPGKQVINIALGKIAPKLGVTNRRLLDEIKAISYKKTSSPLYRLMKTIDQRLK
ncbi:AAA family ATPase [Paraclostridium bifermentans]|uniref:AAA family ATPase n=1 Tax=Paraclostridium bifermentans TaxID=1490 RepID=UPI001FF36A98|nr:AAA family ATPase [Paraclostridium bifermentans]UOW68220.1 AAA family ATPase [Paraclostridium bifermentans]